MWPNVISVCLAVTGWKNWGQQIANGNLLQTLSEVLAAHAPASKPSSVKLSVWETRRYAQTNFAQAAGEESKQERLASISHNYNAKHTERHLSKLKINEPKAESHPRCFVTEFAKLFQRAQFRSDRSFIGLLLFGLCSLQTRTCRIHPFPDELPQCVSWLQKWLPFQLSNLLFFLDLEIYKQLSHLIKKAQFHPSAPHGIAAHRAHANCNYSCAISDHIPQNNLNISPLRQSRALPKKYEGILMIPWRLFRPPETHSPDWKSIHSHQNGPYTTNCTIIQPNTILATNTGPTPPKVILIHCYIANCQSTASVYRPQATSSEPTQ